MWKLVYFRHTRETYEDGLETIRLIKKLDIDFIRFFSLTPYGELARKLGEYGTMVENDLSKFQGNEIVFVPHSMTKEQLEKLISTAYTEYYFRARFIFKRLKSLLRGSP